LALINPDADVRASEIGLDIGPTAGFLCWGVGSGACFGAQKMVQDNHHRRCSSSSRTVINVGDVITVGGHTGTRRKSCRCGFGSLRDVQGVFHMIPFSTGMVVSKLMRGFAYTVC